MSYVHFFFKLSHGSRYDLRFIEKQLEPFLRNRYTRGGGRGGGGGGGGEWGGVSRA